MELAISGLAVLAVVGALAAFVFWARRRTVGTGNKPGKPSSGFSIRRLEKMLAKGQISPQEFAVLRKEVLRLEEEPSAVSGSPSSGPHVRDDGTTGCTRG